MPAADPPVLDVQGLDIAIPAEGRLLPVVRGLGFAIGRGQTLALVGESGSGKSVTALAVMGLLSPRFQVTAARMRCLDLDLLSLDLAGLRAVRGRRIAMVFQDPMTALNPVLRIEEQLCEHYRRHCAASRLVARARAAELLAMVGITEPQRRLRQYPHQLSGGLRQRVMIAMALMCRPDLLIADEPTTGLDATVQMQILTLLASLQQRLGLTILLITHDIGVVSHFAHHIAVLYAGELAEHGAVEPVLDAPRHPYTRALLQAVPELARAGGTSRLRSIAGTVPSLWELDGGCAFRARCGRASPVCATTPPTSVHDEHLVRCHHPWPGQEASL